MDDDETLNIVELGGGNGTLGVGLAMALNGSHTEATKSFQPNAKIMCTDHDHQTVKNMRFNVMQQPKECKVGRAVRAESLDWGNPENNPDVADLATEIEAKVSKGLEDEDDDSIIGEELKYPPSACAMCFTMSSKI